MTLITRSLRLQRVYLLLWLTLAAVQGSAFVILSPVHLLAVGHHRQNNNVVGPALVVGMSQPKKNANDGDAKETGENKNNNNHAMLEELSWRAARIKLEEQNTQRLLKRRPRKLPYLEARKWVQRNLGPDTKEEFDDLVANGNLRTPYIPKKPEEYYTETGDWISWEHFLTWDPKVLGREVPPATGRFD